MDEFRFVVFDCAGFVVECSDFVEFEVFGVFVVLLVVAVVDCVLEAAYCFAFGADGERLLEGLDGEVFDRDDDGFHPRFSFSVVVVELWLLGVLRVGVLVFDPPCGVVLLGICGVACLRMPVD